MEKLKSKLRSHKAPKRIERTQSDFADHQSSNDDAVRMSRQVREDARRYERNTTHMTLLYKNNNPAEDYDNSDDFDENFPLSSARSTTSSSNGGGGAGFHTTDIYRTTEQLRGTALAPLHELRETSGTTADSALPPSSGSRGTTTTTGMSSVRSSSARNTAVLSTASSASTASSSASLASTSEMDALRAEVAAMKDEVHGIRREMMNEMHMTRYDVLKEITMLKGTISQLVSVLHSGGLQAMAASAGVVEAAPAVDLSSSQFEALTRVTSVATSHVTRERIASAARGDEAPKAVNGMGAPAIVRTTSSRLTQMAPVDESALSTPLRQDQIDDMFPLIDCTSKIKMHASVLVPGSRTWVLDRVQDWIDSRFNVGLDVLMALVGEGGTGKSTVAGAICNQLRGNILATHFCEFDRKIKSTPRNVLLSLVNQLHSNLPMFKNHLARLNLRYVLEESDAYVLANKVLLEPLGAMEEPLTAQLIVIDGLDQCRGRSRNDLLEFLSVVLPELPTWIGVLITSKPAPELASKLPISSIIDFSPKNASFIADTAPLVEDLVMNCSLQQRDEARTIMTRKAGGNYAYLEFTRQALSHPGMEEAGAGIPIEVWQDLPESLFDIYAEIFHDKFGQGHSRTWKKVQPLLELIVTSASGPYPLITENQAQENLKLTREEIRAIRRSFVDTISVKSGTYRIECSALYDWLTDPRRHNEQIFVDPAKHVDALRRFNKQQHQGLKKNGSGSFETNSGSSSSDGSNATAPAPGSRTNSQRTQSQRTQSHRTPSQRDYTAAQPTRDPNYRPVGILKQR